MLRWLPQLTDLGNPRNSYKLANFTDIELIRGSSGESPSTLSELEHIKQYPITKMVTIGVSNPGPQGSLFCMFYMFPAPKHLIQ